LNAWVPHLGASKFSVENLTALRFHQSFSVFNLNLQLVAMGKSMLASRFPRAHFFSSMQVRGLGVIRVTIQKLSQRLVSFGPATFFKYARARGPRLQGLTRCWG
jgi:hypothetical protein